MPRRPGSGSISGSAIIDFRSLDIGLLGAFQFNNAAIAITLFLLWLHRSHPGEAFARNRSRGAVGAARRALARPPRGHPAGRRSPLSTSATRPDGIRQSLESLQAIYGADGWILVLGISFDKKAGEIVGALAPSFDMIICTTAHHKGVDAR